MSLPDLHDRLRDALPDAVPILLPGQVFDPPKWQEVDGNGNLLNGGREGLQVYFRQQAPEGYVQLHHDDDVFPVNLLDVGSLLIVVVAPTADLALALKRQVKDGIRNQQVRPTPYTYPSSQTQEHPDHTRIVLTFEPRNPGV